jgi:DNA (cytosine-5)-methyltransferase 1
MLGLFDKNHGGDVVEGSCPLSRDEAHKSRHANGKIRPVVAFPLDLRNTGRDRPGMGLGQAGEPAPTCTAGSTAGVAYAFQPRIGRSGRGQPSDVVPALAGSDAGATSDSRPCVVIRSRCGLQTVVRRFTPRECERLQGFPDDYTLASFQGKPVGDTQRYQVLGNSMAVPVVAWIGRRIDIVDQLISRTHPMSRQRTRRKPRAV